MFPKAVGAACLLVSVCACGGSETARGPSTPTAPSPARWSLSGTIAETGRDTTPANARVEILEGINQGRTADADAQGRYRMDALDQGTFRIQASADGLVSEAASVTLASNQTLDFALKRAANPSQTISGITIDGVTGRPLGGVSLRFDGLGESVSGADGGFQMDAAAPEQVRQVTLSSSSTVERTTHLRAPGPPATLSLIPSSFDLAAFDQMSRPEGVLRRWVAVPRLVVQKRVLLYENYSDDTCRALSSTMTDGEAAALIADLRWTLAQLTDNTFTGFADEQVETAAEGEEVRVSRTGVITVARYEGLTAAMTYWGYTRWAWNGAGEMQRAIVMFDRGFDESNNAYRRSLRAHEFGHALGYWHVTRSQRLSVMNREATVEPNQFDRDAARLVFLRQPLNRTPDIDPDSFSANLRALARQIFWAGDR